MNYMVFELGHTLLGLKGDKEFISIDDFDLLIANSTRSITALKSYISLLKKIGIIGDYSETVEGKLIKGYTFDIKKFNKLNRTWDQKQAETHMIEKKLKEKLILQQEKEKAVK